jgi:hypothetical protein
MRRLTPLERGATLIALVFLIVGVFMIVHPAEMTVFPPGPGPGVYKAMLDPNPSPEHVSKKKCQKYGGFLIAVGLGIGWLAFYRGR